MDANPVATVEAYIDGQPPAARGALQAMRALLRKALPGAEEVISYGMPAYTLNGRVVVYFAGWKRHTALYPGGNEAIAAFANDLAGYATSKGAIRFPLEAPLPGGLIARIAKYRAVQIAEVAGAKRPVRRRRT
jgi:uncharacterized protein YdhG (YjbR/CyaY superfamily)